MIREGENNRVTECLGAFFLKACSQEGGKRSRFKPKPITQSGRGQADQTTTKTNHAVRKGASDPNNNQNQPDPERAPAGSRPSYISQLLHLVACQGRAWNLRGRAWFWLLLALVCSACPPSRLRARFCTPCPLPDLFFLTSADDFVSRRAIILGAREPEALHIPVQLPNR